VVNMLDGHGEAEMSNGLVGKTFKSTPYSRRIGGAEFKIWDTVGLNEGSQGTAPTAMAIENLWWLIKGLDNGVTLLLFVMRGRITEKTHSNYKLFYEVFCGKAVRIVLVMTGMENEEDLQDWWLRNEGHYTKYGMKFDGHACVTTFKGKEGRHQKEYDKSKTMIEELIVENSKEQPWKIDQESWFQRVVVGFFQFGVTDGDAKVLYKALRIHGMNKKEARGLATKAVKKHKEEKKREKLNLTR
jgi:hypothetical protein